MSRPQKKVRIRSNEQIRVPEIRLIGADGEQVGVVPTAKGIEMAQEAGLDLVEVAAQSKPPVCRILDLGKYLYSLSKKEKESRKKQKVVDVKEVKLSPKIADNDYQTKLRSAKKFLSRGDKVKLTMFFRGREITHKELGERIIKRFIEDISDVGEVERNDGLDRNVIHLYFQQNAESRKEAAKAEKKAKAEQAEEGTENAKA